jgi:hypothetical protein
MDSFRRGTLPPPVNRSVPSAPPLPSAQPPQQQQFSPEPTFRTPEQVSQAEDRFTLPEPDVSHLLPEHTEEPPKKRFFLFRKPDFTKKQWIMLGVALAALISGAVTAFLLTRDKAPVVTPKPPVKVAPKPAPKPILSPLTGLPVTLEQQLRPVTAVMVENSSDARPQSGFDQAGVMFEAIAEYGITRFMALYQENSPAVVGPVRSARPYYLDWAMAFDANYAHVGGSPTALQLIKDMGVRDLDQFYNSGAYRRVSHRFAPHNVYTSIDSLVNVGNAKGYTKSTYTPLVRKEKEQASKTPTASKIDLNISSAFYNVHYDYNPATNSYKRSMGGSPHTDAETKAQLSPKVVIALGMPYSLMADGYHSQYQTVGSGNMLVFQDGVVVEGTWSKASAKEQFIFKDGAGADIKLNPGQTWITVLGDITQAAYTP